MWLFRATVKSLTSEREIQTINLQADFDIRQIKSQASYNVARKRSIGLKYHHLVFYIVYCPLPFDSTPKSPLLWSSQPTPVTIKEARWFSVYFCIIISLCLSLVHHSFHKKPHLWCSANPIATTSSLVVLSLPM